MDDKAQLHTKDQFIFYQITITNAVMNQAKAKK